jgi:hypothetical protein
VVALGIELSVVTLSGSPGLPVLDYRFVFYLGCRPMLSAGLEAREHTRLPTTGAHGRQPLSSPYGNRTHLSALKGQYPSPIDERAVVVIWSVLFCPWFSASCSNVCAHRERKVGREALESSLPDLQSGALPSKLPAQRTGFANEKKARRRYDTGPFWPSSL